MKNIKRIYPSPEGDVTEIISLGAAIDAQIAAAGLAAYVYMSNVDKVLDDILCCPCTELTNLPIGKTVKPYSVAKQMEMTLREHRDGVFGSVLKEAVEILAEAGYVKG